MFQVLSGAEEHLIFCIERKRCESVFMQHTHTYMPDLKSKENIIYDTRFFSEFPLENRKKIL